MKRFTFSEVNRLSGQILEAALYETIALTKRGKNRVVMMPYETYRRMTEHSQQAYRLEDAPDSVHDELMQGLEAILSDEDADGV